MIVETYKIKGYKEKETGLLLDENEDWILVKHIPVDYVIDGYKLYRKNIITKRKSKSKEEKIARVLQLKKTKTDIPDTFTFRGILETLKWCEKKYGLFEFLDLDANIFYGKLNESHENRFIIDMIGAHGKIEEAYDYEFSTDEIEVITFETDYFESIRLLMNDEIKNTPKLNKV
ncbi:hypothetical protein [Aquimarina pacifica]|uniref:hypothetical protein n=1 Tax=Aquimarina pacifica TaxID=1296415 RepID=UPI000471858E|nr:hypothetical protein [Aquimarina pacifica]